MMRREYNGRVVSENRNTQTIQIEERGVSFQTVLRRPVYAEDVGWAIAITASGDDCEAVKAACRQIDATIKQMRDGEL